MWLVGVSSNLCWAHHSLRVPAPAGSERQWLERTPAMAAGLTDHPWTLRDVLHDQVPLPAWVAPKRRGRPPKHLTQAPLLRAASPRFRVELPLAGIRQRGSYPIFVPTWVPAGLTPEPPVGGEQPQSGVRLNYHTVDGSVALTVLNGPAGCCLAADPRKTGEPVSVPNGTSAHLLAVQPQYGGPILWWEQDGTYVALSGPQLTRDELVKIAGSMSETADLGRTEAPPARPTPTPVPAPSFTILRPTWLPEPMTGQEQAVPTPYGPGSGVVLTFDPRPGDKPHALLTLREFADARAQVQDPQATREQIGGREVTIGRRGEGCVTASWVQGDVVLLLTNPYDPPGPPGQVRYSCDQFRRIIDSVR